jgi:hypothetical protein
VIQYIAQYYHNEVGQTEEWIQFADEQSPPIELAENLPCALNKTINTADIPQCPFLDKGLMEIDKREM